MKYKAIKIMILGLAFLLFAIQVNTYSTITIFYGFEIYFSILGLILVLIGFFMKDRNYEE